jgi:hypothetical protein
MKFVEGPIQKTYQRRYHKYVTVEPEPRCPERPYQTEGQDEIHYEMNDLIRPVK